MFQIKLHIHELALPKGCTNLSGHNHERVYMFFPPSPTQSRTISNMYSSPRENISHFICSKLAIIDNVHFICLLIMWLSIFMCVHFILPGSLARILLQQHATEKCLSSPVSQRKSLFISENCGPLTFRLPTLSSLKYS